MRLRIDISEVRFRVAATARPAAKSRADQTQKTTPDGQPIWTVRLTAIDTGINSSETIWVEVAGDEPKLATDELVQVDGLVFAPWISGPQRKDHKIVRNFRADTVVLASASGKAVHAA